MHLGALFEAQLLVITNDAYVVNMDQIVRIREGDAEPISIHLNRFSLSAAHH